MIKCPVCNHSEFDGTLFCSECGSRLWGDTFSEDTTTLDREPLPDADPLSALVAPVFPVPAAYQLRINGAKEPIQLSGKTEYLLGRSDPRHAVQPDVDLGPYGGQHLGVSRKHAALVQTEAGINIRDLSSTNGTVVNGRVLAANQDCPLRDGDEIRLGKLALNIYFVIEPENTTSQ